MASFSTGRVGRRGEPILPTFPRSCSSPTPPLRRTSPWRSTSIWIGFGKQPALRNSTGSWRVPDRYETRVGERGARISGGERQRLALARAIYKEAPVLVLDEATSAIDDETEAAIAGALDRLQELGRTIVIVAHRSQLITTCDRILKLENGRIAE